MLKDILNNKRALGLAAVAAALALSAALALAQTGGGFDLSFSTTDAGTTSTGGGFPSGGPPVSPTRSRPPAVGSPCKAGSLAERILFPRQRRLLLPPQRPRPLPLPLPCRMMRAMTMT